MSFYVLLVLWVCAGAGLLYWIAGRAGLSRAQGGLFAGSVAAAFLLGWLLHGGAPAREVAVVPTASPAPPLATPERATFREAFTDLRFPDRVQQHQQLTGTVVVHNTSPRPWSAKGAAPIRLGFHVLDEAGHAVREGRGALHDFAAGETFRIPFVVTTPDAAGRYTLKVDMVYESCCWFESFGNKPAIASITAS